MEFESVSTKTLQLPLDAKTAGLTDRSSLASTVWGSIRLWLRLARWIATASDAGIAFRLIPSHEGLTSGVKSHMRR